MRFALVCALCGALAACLSSPPPAGDGDGVDAGVDGATPTGMAWPGDHQIDIRKMQRLDFNGDDIDDLLIANSGTVPAADRGVFILLGPQSDPATLEYHIFVRTDVEPLDFLVHDIVGDSDLADIIVLGSEDSAAPLFVEVYPQIAENTFDPGVRSRDTGLSEIDVNSPNIIQVAAVNDGVVDDIVVADLNQMFAFVWSDPDTDFAVTTPIEIRRDGSTVGTPFESINGILTRETPGQSTGDLVIVENQDVQWLRNDGAGGLTNVATANNGGNFSMFTAQEATVSGADVVLGGSPQSLGGFRLQQGATPTIEALLWAATEVPSLEFSTLLVGNLDAQAAPDVLVLDEMTEQRVRVFRNVTTAGNDIEPPNSVDRFTPGLEPATGAIADFDDDGTSDVWVFDRVTGAAACVRFDGNTLAACP